MTKSIEQLCADKGLRMTGQRRLIVSVLSENFDKSALHPNADELYQLVTERDPRISLATIYRTLRLLEESGVLEKIEFGDGKNRYERANRKHHDHLIDTKTGEVIEFSNADIEQLQKKIAHKLGYKLVHHRLQLFGEKLKGKEDNGDNGDNAK